MRSLLLAATFAGASAAGLRDEPIVADTIQLLDSTLWTATNNGTISVPGHVPGDLVTDLELGGIIGDPLFERNFKSVVWDATDFTYNLTFDAALPIVSAPNKWLILDGIKMGSFVWLNGVFLGATADQFLRYRYDVTAILKRTGNAIQITFPPSNNSLNDEARWMACSGAWDWAPYTSTYNSQKAHTFSKGIVKSVYLLGVASAAIEHLQPRIWYNGSYPTAPLSDAAAGPWTVEARVHLLAPAPVAGSVIVTGSWPGATPQSAPAALAAGNNTVIVSLAVPAAAVRLWWPNGLGSQALYNVTATWTPSAAAAAGIAAAAPVAVTRSVGFRFIALVTGNDTDPATLAGVDGSGSFTMRLNVNGAKIWSRGANLIPMEEMDGRLSVPAYQAMMASAAAAGYNTLRVWGGGLFYHDAVYDAADALGLLMYHDMQYGQPWFGGNSGVPTANAMQEAEMRHQLRRLSHHPCIALWDACNECGGGDLWGSFVMPIVVDEEPSKPAWPACPSNGFAGGVDRLTGLPNGKPLSRRAVPPEAILSAPPPPPPAAPALHSGATCTPLQDVDYAKGTYGPLPSPAEGTLGDCCDACTATAGCVVAVYWQGSCYMKTANQTQWPSWGSGITAVWVAGQTPVVPPDGGCNEGLTLETHGYYQHGEGFQTVNSGAALQPFAPNVPPALDRSFELGAQCPGTYASEFGASAWSSFESVSPTLSKEHWSLHADPIYERNYAADNFVTVYFNVPWPAYFTNSSLQAQLYLTIVAQGLLVKSDISTRRARNSWGTVTWQHNEIWPTGGWGGIEYGTVGFTPGQVLGGRWKPVMHFMAAHLYTDLFVTCGDDGRCLVKNDDPLAGWAGTLVLAALHVGTSAITEINRTAVALGRGAGAAAWMCAAGGGSPWAGTCAGWEAILAPLGLSPATAVLTTTLLDAQGAVVYASFELLVPPSALLPAMANATVTAAVGAPAPDGSSVPVTVTADAAALFVGLTTAAHGRFSENFFVMGAGSRTLAFLPTGALDVPTLAATLRVEHVRSYL